MADCVLIDHLEIWKPIPFRPDIEASEFGHLRRKSDGKIIGQHLDHHGYPTAVIGSNRQRMRTSIGVCAAFHGPKPSPAHVVRHLNGARADNRAINLRWGTQKENIHDKYAHGTMGFGERNPYAKLNAQAVREIRRLCPPGRTGPRAKQRDVAEMFGVSQGAVSSIVRGKTWGHLK